MTEITRKINKWEWIVFSLVLLSLLIGLYVVYGVGVKSFEENYVVEDGLVEYGSALFLLAIGIYCFYKTANYRKRHPVWWLVGTIGLGLLFIFGAGEEVSWGQRLLGFETPDALKEINRQDEVTLHNIRIGDFDVNKIIFSKLLTAILIFYFTIYPLLYRGVAWIKKLTNALGIPVPQWHHTIFFLIATLIALLIPSEKKWELHEFVFSAIFFVIFLFPFNKSQID